MTFVSDMFLSKASKHFIHDGLLPHIKCNIIDRVVCWKWKYHKNLSGSIEFSHNIIVLFIDTNEKVEITFVSNFWYLMTIMGEPYTVVCLIQEMYKASDKLINLVQVFKM